MPGLLGRPDIAELAPELEAERASKQIKHHLECEHRNVLAYPNFRAALEAQLKTSQSAGDRRLQTVRSGAVRNESVRASDADRERVADRLRDHTVAGRLTTEELDERSGRAFAARTRDQLDALLADLPRDLQRGPAPAKAAALLLAEGILWVVVGVIIVTIAILWALALAVARLARLAAAAAARSLGSGGAPALR